MKCAYGDLLQYMPFSPLALTQADCFVKPVSSFYQFYDIKIYLKQILLMLLFPYYINIFVGIKKKWVINISGYRCM